MRAFLVGSLCAGAVGLALMPAACGVGGVQLADVPTIDGGNPEGGEAGAFARGVGQRCDDGGVCRDGLACTNGVCQPGRSAAEGTACVISAECKDGLFCGPERKCSPAGAGAAGAACTSDAECKSGFRCNLVGLETQCQPEGATDVGGQCKLAGDCFGGLLCAESVCAPNPPGIPPIGLPTYKGVACETETGAVAAHFHVPRGNAAEDKDYFRLPFPNDVRLTNGKPNLAGFPTPGSDLLGFDLVDRWARYLELTGTGWSAYPTVTFRFSGEIDFDSLKVAGATKWVDVTTGENGNDLGHNWAGSTGRTAYICPNHLGFRPPTGAPLKSGHTYAVFMTNAAKAKGGTPIAVSPDLTAVLGATDPGGALSAAWAAYAPLRTWAAAKTFNLTTLVNASVFTVGKHTDVASKLVAAVNAAPAPTASGWVKCGGGAVSPCPQATNERACPATADPNFDELHALVKLPNFQKGNLPYTEPADGGDVEFVNGNPTQQGDLTVCMSLTVPTGAMPAAGWPLVVYSHGTGGSFRSHVSDASGRLANVDAGAKKIAVLGIDQVAHGTRRGTSTASPANIFFNFPNPAASRGNVLQGAADQAALVKFARALDLNAGTSPTSTPIKFDLIAFWGHSQGATVGSIAMPYTPDVTGALFSGAGASLLDSLLTKKSPVNIANIVPVVLSEAPANISTYHPVLGMFQNAIDPADPLSYAPPITAATGPLAKHVFVPYGQGDTYSTPITQLTYVTAANLAVAQHPASVTAPDNLIKAPTPIPVGGNNGGKTAVVRQYTPVGFDGHFVAFKDAQGIIDANRFLADSVTLATTPQIGR